MATETLTIPIRGTKFSYNVEVRERLCSHKTDYQQIDIVDTEAFGRMLFLDGHVQLAELDEHAYHESLVQIPLLSIPHPRRALVIGGGDGGVLRELCRHTDMQHVDMAEIDAGVIEACREHLPFLSDGAFDDPRVHVHVTDAFEFVRSAKEPYDLIVADSTDVYEDESGGLSERLFTQDFYRDCRRLLSDRGLLVTQADNLLFCPYSLVGIEAVFREVFDAVGAYQALVPSFGGFSGFCWAATGGRIRASADIPAGAQFRYLNPLTWQLAFTPLPFGAA